MKSLLLTLPLSIVTLFSTSSASSASVEIYQTARSGDRLASLEVLNGFAQTDHTLKVNPEVRFQSIVGFGGAFTEAGAHALSELSGDKRAEVLRDYFAPEGAHLSLTRTHIASCDFSLKNYTYAPVPGDVALEHFSIEPDYPFLLPMIQDALKVAGADFKIMASPWTCPPW